MGDLDYKIDKCPQSLSNVLRLEVFLRLPNVVELVQKVLYETVHRRKLGRNALESLRSVLLSGAHLEIMDDVPRT